MISPKEQLIRLADAIRVNDFKHYDDYEYFQSEIIDVIKKLEVEENENTN